MVRQPEATRKQSTRSAQPDVRANRSTATRKCATRRPARL